MAFENSCFISYRRGQEELTQTFIRELENALKSYIEPLLDKKVYVDYKDLQAGDFLDRGLAQALCKSVCMIMVFTPKYFSSEHLYCTREFLAMETLEKKRFEIAGITPDQQQHSFIIPIALRRPDCMPLKIKRKRLYCDFSKYTLVEPNISRNPNYVQKIDEIADYIYERHQEFCQYNDQHDYDNFPFPTEADALAWLNDTMKLPLPNPPFPGRQEGK